MSAARPGNELRAGIFLAVGVLVFTGAIFLIGQKNALFSRTTTLFVSFEDISGLVVGAPVRLAGLDVGAVTAISFPEDLSRKEARVRLAVQTEYMTRIRADSLAFIDSNGLLGDKIVNISMGDPSSPALTDGATLETGRTVTFESLSTNIDQAISAAASISVEVEKLIKDLRATRLTDDVARISSSLAAILQEVETGQGTAHRLVYDRRYADHIGGILAETHSLTKRAQRAVARADAVLQEVERGDGTAHALIYGADGKQVLQSLGEAAGEIRSVVREVREGHGVVHSLVYEEGHTNFLRELNQLSATLNRMVQEMDKGRGTIGGLMKDPTIYEDLKTVLGNVKRNVLFKALVRWTMEEEGLRRVENAPSVSAETPEPSSGDAREGAAAQEP